MFPATDVVINFDDTIPVELGIFPTTRAGWVLTGGRSSRMGQDKALIEVAGRPLALRVADSIAAACGRVTLVGDPARYAALGLPVIPDLHPDLGPMSGIEAALVATEADWNLIVACDMPALDAGSLQELFRAAEASESDIAVPAHSAGLTEPLCAVYHRRVAGSVREALEAGNRKVIEFQASFQKGSRVIYVRVQKSEQFANLNTPDDLTRHRNA